MDILWLDEVGNLIAPIKYGDWSYAGNYRLIYFKDFKALQVKTSSSYKLLGPVPPNLRSCYSAAEYFGV